VTSWFSALQKLCVQDARPPRLQADKQASSRTDAKFPQLSEEADVADDAGDRQCLHTTSGLGGVSQDSESQ
jgi:hypothetical protein